MSSELPTRMLLARAKQGYSLLKLECENDDLQGHTETEPLEVSHVSVFSPDGNLLAISHPTHTDVVDVLTNTVKCVVPFKDVRLAHFSPNGTYLVTYSMNKKLEGGKWLLPDGGLCVWKVVQEGECELLQSWHYYGLMKDLWPVVVFSSDEKLALRVGNDKVLIFADGDFRRCRVNYSVPKCTNASFSPCNEKRRFAVFSPSYKGQDASLRVYDIPEFAEQEVASPTEPCAEALFCAEEATIQWNKQGDKLLAKTYSAVQSGQYCGSKTVHFLHADGSFQSCIPADKLQDVAWDPRGNQFAVIAGYPTKCTLHEVRQGKPVTNLGGVGRNTLRFSPTGRFLVVGGFGNMAGHMDFWDLSKKVIIGTAEHHGAKTYEWSPCGRYFLTGAHLPRMVDNCVRVHAYDGSVLLDRPMDNLFQVTWRPALPNVFPSKVPLRRPKRTDAVKVAEAPRSYVPPHLRGKVGSASASSSASGGGRQIKAKDMRSDEEKKAAQREARRLARQRRKQNARQRKEEQEEKPQSPQPQSQETLDPAKQLRKLKKKLRAIEQLEQKQAEGTKLNAAQVAKISTKSELAAEIAQVESQITSS
ncbi:MAG: hypothetical protein MHM6MM_006881 [Cercozoa sp. M6MM]